MKKSIMQIFLFSDKHLSWLTILALGSLTLFKLYHGVPDLWEDSETYINFSSFRPPLYPIFLWVFHFFGKYQFYFVMWTQTLLSFFSLIYMEKWFQKSLNIPKLIGFLILILTIGIIYNYYTVGNKILSEALAFPAFMLTFTFLVDAVKDFDHKKLVGFALGVSCLILIRHQFYYFYLLFPVIFFWFFWCRKFNKNTMISLILVIATIFLNVIIEKSYFSIVKSPSSGSDVGKHLLTQFLYSSNLTDVKYLKNTQERAIFENMIVRLENQGLTRSTASQTLHPPITLDTALIHSRFATNATFGVIETSFPSNILVKEKNAIMLKISKELSVHETKKYFEFYLWKVSQGIGSFWVLLSLLIVVVAFFVRCSTDRSWSPNKNQIVLILAILIILLNAAFVAAFQSYEPRFYYYSYFLYFCLGGLVAKELWITASPQSRSEKFNDNSRK